MQQVPRDVLHDGRVAAEDGERVEGARRRRIRVDVPQADRVVVARREQVAVHVLVPREAVALLRVT